MELYWSVCNAIAVDTILLCQSFMGASCTSGCVSNISALLLCMHVCVMTFPLDFLLVKPKKKIDLWELAEKPLTSCCICIHINQAMETIWWTIEGALGVDVICCLLVCSTKR